MATFVNALALYAAAGVVTALAFVSFGVTRVQTRAGVGRRAHPADSGRGGAVAVRARALAEVVAMRRFHRIAHHALWPVLAIALALGVTLALVLRPPPEPTAPPAVEAPRS